MVMIINTKIGAPDMTASFNGANDRILTKLIMRLGERIYKIKMTMPFLAMPIADALAKGGSLNIPAGHYLFVGMLGAPVIGLPLSPKSSPQILYQRCSPTAKPATS